MGSSQRLKAQRGETGKEDQCGLAELQSTGGCAREGKQTSQRLKSRNNLRGKEETRRVEALQLPSLEALPGGPSGEDGRRLPGQSY